MDGIKGIVDDVRSRQAVLTPDEYDLARERGRRMAAEAMRVNPESKRRQESKLGVNFCRQRYPEAYK